MDGNIKCGSAKCGSIECGRIKCGSIKCGSAKCGCIKCVQHMDGAQAGKQQTDCHPQYTARQLPPTHNTLPAARQLCRIMFTKDNCALCSQDNVRHCGHCHPPKIQWTARQLRTTMFTRQPKKLWTYCYPLTIDTLQQDKCTIGGSQDNTRESTTALKEEMEKRVLAGWLVWLLINWGHVCVPDTHCGHKPEPFDKFWLRRWKQEIKIRCWQ